MKICLSPYQLNFIKGGSRRGYLLRIKNNDGAFGYGDIFPWPEFGDPSFDEIPQKLIDNNLTPLLKKSLTMACRDALARQRQQPLIKPDTISNHALIVDSPKNWLYEVEKRLSLGFQKVKIKVGTQPQEELLALKELSKIKKPQPWVRLDFNGRGDQAVLSELASFTDMIEFVEDPSLISQLWQPGLLPWAYDQPSFSSNDVEYDFRIIKPAKMSVPKESKTLVFTSYMDHPVGVAHGVVEAQQSGRITTESGFLSFQLYQETEFHGYLHANGPDLEWQCDSGIGFTEALEKQKWENIVDG